MQEPAWLLRPPRSHTDLWWGHPRAPSPLHPEPPGGRGLPRSLREWPELDGNQVQWASSVVRGAALDTTSVHLSIHPLPALSYALDTAVTGQRSLGNLADIRDPWECCPLASDSPDDTPKL